MSRIADLFLRAKHWQIFALLCVTYIVASAVTVTFASRVKPSPIGVWANFSTAVLLVEVAWAPFILCYLGWVASVGLFLNWSLDPEVKLRTGFFCFALIYAALYLLVALPVFLGTNPVVWRAVIFFHVFALICVFYALNFVAKTLKVTDQGRPVIMHEHGKELLLLFLFPLGIWLIQPRINRIYQSERRQRR